MQLNKMSCCLIFILNYPLYEAIHNKISDYIHDNQITTYMQQYTIKYQDYIHDNQITNYMQQYTIKYQDYIHDNQITSYMQQYILVQQELFYMHQPRQQVTDYGLCYTSCGAMAKNI